jgi:EthD domain
MEVGRGSRLAFMLHAAPGVSSDAFAEQLTAAAPRLREIASSFGAKLRMGVTYPVPASAAFDASGAFSESTDGAVEISLGEDGLSELCAHAGEFGAVVRPFSDTSRSLVLAGIMHHVFEPSDGDVFLSLTFRREPGTTLQEMRDWWLNQHAVVATSFQRPEMIGYDQVHVEHDVSEQASKNAGFDYRCYDSYDNVTWEHFDGFVASVVKPGAMEAIRADEEGHLDHSTYIGSLMAPIR